MALLVCQWWSVGRCFDFQWDAGSNWERTCKPANIYSWTLPLHWSIFSVELLKATSTLVSLVFHYQQQLENWKSWFQSGDSFKHFVPLINIIFDWPGLYLGIMPDYGDESHNQTRTKAPSLAVNPLLIKSFFILVVVCLDAGLSILG